ncbi:MAG: 1-acyl-sn-glycerol-3-phosphate acyltransferase [Gordonia sp. (in: high G+C Gram-positive bacteria)]
MALLNRISANRRCATITIATLCRDRPPPSKGFADAGRIRARRDRARAAVARRPAGRQAAPPPRVGNLDDRDPDAVRELLPGLWLLISAWYRPDIRGLHHIPAQGPALIVGNHTGGIMSPEVLISQLAITAYFGVERQFYQLAHRMVLNSPLAPILRRFGTVEADPDNGNAVLAGGGLLQVFPGGDHEVYRPTSQASLIDFAGRKGFLRLALKHDVPIVPQVTIGGQETALFLSRGDKLAELLHLDRVLRLKVLPIVLSAPFGFTLPFAPFLPLPAKIVVQYLPPIDLRARFGEHPDLDEVYTTVVGEMQDVLTALAAERKVPVIG